MARAKPAGSPRRSRMDSAGRASTNIESHARAATKRAQCLNAAFTIRGRVSASDSSQEQAMFFFDTHTWRGERGRRYKLKCVLSKGQMPAAGVGGIYVFVRRRWAFFLEPLYVGKAHDIRNRLLGHEKW